MQRDILRMTKGTQFDKSIKGATLVLSALVLILLNACAVDKAGSEQSTDTETKEIVSDAMPDWTQQAVYYNASIDPELGGSLVSVKREIPHWAQMGIDVIAIGPSKAITTDSIDALVSLTSLAHSEGLRVILDCASETKQVKNMAILEKLINQGFLMDGIILSDSQEAGPEWRNYLVEDGLLLSNSVEHAQDNAVVQGYLTSIPSDILQRVKSDRAALSISQISINKRNEEGTDIELVLVQSGLVSKGQIKSRDEYTRAAQAEAVLLFTYAGSPMIGFGQECNGLISTGDERIDWSHRPYSGFFKRLISLRKENGAMAPMTKSRAIVVQEGEGLAYYREGEGESIFVLINLSPIPQKMVLETQSIIGYYEELFTGEELDLEASYTETLQPWGYRVYEIRH